MVQTGWLNHRKIGPHLGPNTMKRRRQKIELSNPFGIQITEQHTYKSLLRTTAYCIAFLRKFTICRRRNIFQNHGTPPVFQAYLLWIKTTQQQEYSNEMKLLTEKRRNQLISKLRLFTDNHGIIRAAGRLQHAPLPYNERNPILLPPAKKYNFTFLIIKASHEATLHAGTIHTLSHLRNLYWITKFRLSNNCFPFTYIGIDTAGHFWIRQKYWILIATCLNTRAIALEPLRDMTTATLNEAFERISARRTTPHFVVSDNADQHILPQSFPQNKTASRTRSTDSNI